MFTYYPNKKTKACAAWFSLESLSKVSDTMGLLYDQATEKAEESGENEAQKEDNEDSGNLAESPEKNVSVFFFFSPSFHWIRFIKLFLSSSRVPGIFLGTQK